MVTLRLPGTKVDVTPEDKAPWQDLAGFGVSVDVLQRQDVIGVVRGEPLDRATLTGAADDDVVELTFDGDVKQYLSVAQLREESATVRGEEGDVVEVPAVFSRGRATRGMWDWVLRGLRVLRIRPDAAIADLGEAAVVERFESRLSPPAGLYRVGSSGALSPAANLDISSKWLLFIHGTASSTNGSFGGLFGTTEWTQLRKFYDDRILALQHKTLSVSPIDNALDVAEQLPAGARLHLVTHSRGGLVGELLGITDFTDDALRAFRKRHRDADIEKLHRLRDLLKTKQFVIEKFVRVAGPARGTILASKRLDIYLSVLLNLVGAIPLLSNDPIYAVLKASAMELIRRRTQPDHLPGLEAMMPESPLIHFLNQGLSSTADLAVIAGDLQGEGFFGRLKAFVTDAFYLEEHDLVVNTAAMFGGVSRQKAVGVYDRGAEVNHFSYFSNERTRSRLHAWLTSAADSGFIPFDQQKPGINIPPMRAAETDRPALVIVPDVLGSVLTLKQGKVPVWLDAAALSKHGFEVVADPSSTSTTEKDLVGAIYQKLIDGFATTHEVIPFPWDWRGSIAAATKDLAAKIADLAKAGRTLHLIGHGAGGLVIRGLDDGVWASIARALLLGTAEHGMFRAVQWCSPRFRLARMLSTADGTLEPGDVAEKFRGFAAVVELVPDLFLDPATRGAAWKSADVPQPADGLLDAALQLRQLPRPNAKIVGVAGRAAETPVAYNAAKKELTITAAGDGQVTTDSLHAELRQYRVEAAHGDLPSHAGAFSAYLQLLTEGKTPLLSQPQKVTTSTTTTAFVEEPLLFPDNRELLSEAMTSATDRAAQDDYSIAVSVTHGDLRAARYPVAVGHHVGDSIVSAEAVLDCLLDRRLSRRFNMGLYPAEVGTSEVVLDPEKSPRGAIIIGLGEVGSATADVIRRGIAAAALRHALAVAEAPRKKDDIAWRSAGIASVAIGTRGGSKLTLVESIAAIVRGAVDANRVLRRQKLWEQVRIDAVELIELYEQRAISTVYAARQAVDDVVSELEPGERVDLVTLLRPTTTGQFRIPPEDWQTGWWQRLSITMDKAESNDPDAQQNRPFKYVVMTDRARIEASMQCNERGSTYHLIKEAAKASRFDPELAGTLFELLVPNPIKSAAATAPSVVLMLDKETAQIPWEMLTDGLRGERRPQSVRSGMIRQLEKTEFRHAPHYTEVHNAFVVGDTRIDQEMMINGKLQKFAELRGAQDEAKAASQALSDAGYEVTMLQRSDAATIQKQLFARPYRVVHLAGHGIYDPDRPARTGMVLGPDIYLTACQLRQMRVVPDLVFINCCHLGNIDTFMPEPHRMAASVAEELIAMGVKAVIAAGWAVDDSAGVTFASTLYEQFLGKRRPFGDAVRKAREATFEKHPATNTWAAYQCYGNPGLKLADETDDTTPRDGSRFCARREYLDEVRSLAGQASGLGGGDARGLVIAAMTELERTIIPEWNDGEMRTEFGLAWRALGDFEKAREAFEGALVHDSARVSLQGIEQLGNILSRIAVDAYRANNPGRGRELFQRSEALLTLVASVSPTSERWSLLGSLRKKVAQFEPEPRRTELLRESAASYANAAENGRKPYPLINQVAVQWVADKTIDAPLRQQFAAAKAAIDANRDVADFWDRLGIPDYTVTQQLIDSTPLDVDTLEKLYLYAAQQSGSDGQKKSVLEQLEYLGTMLQEAKLLELAARLRTKWQIPP